MTRPLALPFTALEVAGLAIEGRLCSIDRLRLAEAPLAEDVEADARRAARRFLAATRGAARGSEEMEAAGRRLMEWLGARYQVRRDHGGHDWQVRADCGLD